MEEQIYKMITSNIETMDDVGVLNSCKEIAAHVKEFIEWLFISKEFPLKEEQWGNVLMFTNGEIKTFAEDFTLDEVYQYWLINIKKS